MALTDNGYYTFSNTGDSTYHFYLKDHQGNNRVVVSQSGSVEQINHYYPYGALFAESTNGDVQRFKYNGKELDRKFGLNWYDHGARHNDAAIGRWHSMDKNAEKYYGISPYAYCGGDPVNKEDYGGMNPVFLPDGTYWGTTEEGFTGNLYIFYGDTVTINKDNIHNYSAEDLKVHDGYTFDEVTDPNALLCFGVALDDNQAGKIINSFLGQLSEQSGFQEYNIKTFGPAFSFNRFSGVVYDSNYSQNHALKVSAGSHFAALKKDAGGYQAGQILMSANLSYEATVENLAATIVYHEYYGHLIQGFGDLTGTHYKAYLNSKNCPYYKGTTQKYKDYLKEKLKH